MKSKWYKVRVGVPSEVSYLDLMERRKKKANFIGFIYPLVHDVAIMTNIIQRNAIPMDQISHVITFSRNAKWDCIHKCIDAKIKFEGAKSPLAEELFKEKLVELYFYGTKPLPMRANLQYYTTNTATMIHGWFLDFQNFHTNTAFSLNNRYRRVDGDEASRAVRDANNKEPIEIRA